MQRQRRRRLQAGALSGPVMLHPHIQHAVFRIDFGAYLVAYFGRGDGAAAARSQCSGSGTHAHTHTNFIHYTRDPFGTAVAAKLHRSATLPRAFRPDAATLRLSHPHILSRKSHAAPPTRKYSVGANQKRHRFRIIHQVCLARHLSPIYSHHKCVRLGVRFYSYLHGCAAALNPLISVNA